MNAFLRMLAECTLAMSAVICLVLAALPLLGKKCSARSVSLVFLIVFLGLLIPWRLSPARPAVTLTLPAAATARPAAYPAVQPVAGRQETAAQPAGQAATQTRDTAVSAAQGAAEGRPLPVGKIVFCVWAAGALAVLLWNLCGYARFRRIVRRWARPVQEERCRRALRQARRDVGVKAPARLRCCPAVGSPMLVGANRPMILLPDLQLNDRELALIFRHELTHLKRRDVLRKAIALAGCTLHWFNPLVWIAARSQAFYCEAACDESVLRGADLDERQYYSETIIAVIRRQSGPRTVLSTSFYGGKKGMKKRILAIMSQHRKRLGALLVAAALAATLGAGMCFALATEEAQSAENTPISVEWPYGLNRESAVQLAKEACLSRVAWDFGVQGYETSGAMRNAALDWNGESVPVLEVPLTATLGDGSQYEHLVEISMDTAEVIRIDVSGPYADGTAYESADYRPAQKESLGLTMWTASPISQAANLCNAADDYEWPSEIVFNGAAVTVHETMPTMGGYPHDLLDDPDEMWARVTVGATDGYSGAEGYIPLVCLTDAQPAAALPAGTIVTDEPTGYVGVLADDGLTRDTAGTLAAGTQVELIGRTNGYWHIRAGRTQGFVPLENIELSADAQAAMQSCEKQVRGYDEIQPGWQARYEEFQAQLTTMYNRYGDPSGWPLAARAQASQMALDYGFTWLADMICILPGTGDLSEEEAVEKATAAAQEAFGLTADDIANRSVYFYYPIGEPQNRMWKVGFVMKAGHANCAVYLNAAGVVTDTWQSSQVNAADPYIPERPYMPEQSAAGSIEYYLLAGDSAVPEEGEITRDEAIERARAMLAEAWPGSADETCDVMAEMRETSIARWWLVTLSKAGTGEYGVPDFHAALLCPDGETAFTDAEEYAAQRRQIQEWEEQDAQREALEKERGVYDTWLLEQKAEWEPELFGLPGEGDMTQEEAVQAAREAVKTRYGLTDAELDEMIVCRYFYRDGRWRIDFRTKEQLETGRDGYEVWMDAKDGSEPIDMLAPGEGNG